MSGEKQDVSPSGDGPEERLNALANRMNRFREGIREEAEQAIKDYLRWKNPQTVEDKKDTVSKIKAFADHLGLGFEYEGQRCRFQATISDKRDRKGYYRLAPIAQPSGAYLKSSSSLENVMDFSLIALPMPSPTTRRTWQDRMGDGGQGPPQR